MTSILSRRSTLLTAVLLAMAALIVEWTVVQPEITSADGSTVTRASEHDFVGPNNSGNDAAWGIWSDGEVMYVSDFDDDKLYAYDLDTKQRISDKDINLTGDNDNPRGIWSDGETIWVVDRDRKLAPIRSTPTT